jgi:hypothetical protein
MAALWVTRCPWHLSLAVCLFYDFFCSGTNFIKLFFGILNQVLTRVWLLRGTYYSSKTFCEIETYGQFHKTFFSVIYSAIGVLAYYLTLVMLLKEPITEKGLIRLTPVANFIKLFQHNLRCYWCIGIIFDLCYAAIGTNYCKNVL